MKTKSLIYAFALATSPSISLADIAFDFAGDASLSVERIEKSSEYVVPLGPFKDGSLESVSVSGDKRQEVWRIARLTSTTAELLAHLRSQVEDAGYDITFECDTQQCGGFDFRFGIEVVEAPDMHVDIGDFKFLTARSQGVEGENYISLLVSRSSETGFVQVTSIGERELVIEATTVSTKATASDETPVELGVTLLDKGVAVLEGLQFGAGAADLSDQNLSQLNDLAAFLASAPHQRIVLVGHTDAQGPLAANIALSKKRAEIVMAKLVDDFGVPAEQVTAEGIGFLSPRAPNTTPEGRSQNRRVEVILTPTL
jgi:outer membrane protein OmpA-like peptidoglycan-associated protein